MAEIEIHDEEEFEVDEDGDSELNYPILYSYYPISYPIHILLSLSFEFISHPSSSTRLSAQLGRYDSMFFIVCWNKLT